MLRESGCEHSSKLVGILRRVIPFWVSRQSFLRYVTEPENDVEASVNGGEKPSLSGDGPSGRASISVLRMAGSASTTTPCTA